MQVIRNAVIEHELHALLDDTRLLVANLHYGTTSAVVQCGISARKKEIRASLKAEWLSANPSLTSRDFDGWLNAEATNSPMLKDWGLGDSPFTKTS